jgi:DivIVA domain-containing protein
MTEIHGIADEERRLTPSDVHAVRFTRASVMHPGYVHTEVDRFLNRLTQEMARLTAEKAELRDQVHHLQAQLENAAATPPPSEQAVRILSSAQQTADAYVAEAEDFSRQMTIEARSQYEEQVRIARENAGAILQAAQEAAAKIGGHAAPPATLPETEELQEQIAYLRAFGQATRVQLRAYLEALLQDVENEWGRAHPAAALPQAPLRMPAQRSDGDVGRAAQAAFFANHVADASSDDEVGEGLEAAAGSRRQS